MRKFIRSDNLLNLLLVFVPVTLILEYWVHAPSIYVFASSALAIVPLAGMMGKATEELSEHVGQGLGGLLNATFGNAAELIIAIIALRAGFHDIVKASLTGSIIGNVLLVFGLSAITGGIGHSIQRFNKTAASLGATMLVLSSIALVVPAVFHQIAGSRMPAVERELSLEIAFVLLATYGLSLLFTLKTHRHLYAGEPGSTSKGAAPAPLIRSAGLLLAATVLVAWMSEFLIGATEEAARSLGMSKLFIGVILVAVVGNAAEHSTAVIMAHKNKMDLALHVAVGSSIQIALFVAPVLVFLSYFIGPAPMDLQFTAFEVLAVVTTVGIMALVSQDGESNWMEGVQLVAVYVILGIAFFFLPE